MKYTQFLQLSDILEKNEMTVADFKTSFKNLPEKLFEADDLETEKGNIVTRWGRIKTSLNKVAQKTQKQVYDSILTKNLPNILSYDKQIAEKVKSTTVKEQNIKNIQKVVIDNYRAIQKQQTQQITTVENAIVKFLENISVRMNKKIEASKSTDKNKTMLKNYWLLLVTQISLNASAYIVRERVKIIDQIFADNKNVAKLMKGIVTTEQNKTIAVKEQKVNKRKETIKTEEKTLSQPTTDNPAENKQIEEKPAEEKPTSEKPIEEKPKV